jgi:pyruvate dehydrogenase E2 component (dihydrolipoamide acetyltransferase)
MVEGTIVRWLKKQGDRIAEGEPLLEIETDKTNLEIRALASGTLLAILRKEGETVPVAETIALIGDPGEDISAFGRAEDSQTVGESSSPVGQVRFSGHASPRARMIAGERKIDLSDVSASGPEGMIIERDITAYISRGGAKPKATHLAERVALQKGLDIARIGQPAAGERLRKEDVLRFVAENKAAQPSPSSPSAAVMPLSAMRRTIARRMKESLAASAQAYMANDIDCTELIRMRDGLRKSGEAVTFTDIAIKIVAMSLKKHAIINSRWTDEGISLRNDVNIGMAVALEEGLVVPVIRAVDTLTLKSINEKSRELIAKANAGKLRPEDLEGSGFTITNLGMYEVDRFTAIINQPESAILAVGRIAEKPAVIDHVIQVRPLMTLSLTYDHRVIDGAPAAKFMRTVKEYFENPYLLI